MYDRNAAVFYAHKWAYLRNPQFYDFDSIGGDCTNFASQVLLAGGIKQNYEKNGWFYKSLNERSPSWTSVKALYSFLKNNKGIGPKAKEIPLGNAIPGDLIMLGSNEKGYYHTVILVQKENYLVAAHTVDSDNRPLRTYVCDFKQALRIE